jgi:hypothetical protein
MGFSCFNLDECVDWRHPFLVVMARAVAKEMVAVARIGMVSMGHGDGDGNGGGGSTLFWS